MSTPLLRPAAMALAELEREVQRRQRAEQAAAANEVECRRLASELQRAHAHAATLARELGAAEHLLREGLSDGRSAQGLNALHGQRILFVGGRPSATPAIRAFVLRHGGHFEQHDGGLEDRQGVRVAAIARAGFVFFAVDCLDPETAGQIKRECLRLGTPFVPLRSASLASFAAAVAGLRDSRSPRRAGEPPPACLRHA